MFTIVVVGCVISATVCKHVADVFKCPVMVCMTLVITCIVALVMLVMLAMWSSLYVIFII